MRFVFYLVLPVFVLMFSATSAFAQSTGWAISEAKGTVLIIDNAGERIAKPGSEVASGAVVRTKAGSTAVMVRGREFVTLRQNAQIRIPEASRPRTVIQVLQDYGTAIFKIGKQADPHFGVETPYLAAVVKGTSFVISVSEEAATLQVTEGAVEVSTPDGGARDLILPGQAAMVAAADTMRMVVEGDSRRVIESPARPASGNEPALETEPNAGSPEKARAPSGAGYLAANENRPAPNRGASNAPRTGRVDRLVVNTPGDLGQYSGGLVSGQVAVLAVAAVDNPARGSASPFATRETRTNDGVACQQGRCVSPGARPADAPGNATPPGNNAPGNDGNSGAPVSPGNGGNAPGNSGENAPPVSPGNSANPPVNAPGNQGSNGPPTSPGNSATPGNTGGNGPQGLGGNYPNNAPASQPRNVPGGAPRAAAGAGNKP